MRSSGGRKKKLWKKSVQWIYVRDTAKSPKSHSWSFGSSAGKLGNLTTGIDLVLHLWCEGLEGGRIRRSQ